MELSAIDSYNVSQSIILKNRNGYFLKDKATTVPYVILVVIASLVGTVGNSMVISAVLINKKLRTVGNIFIVNLAIADLCVTGFVDPLNIVSIVQGKKWFTGRFALCEAIASICLTSCFCSLLSIGAISFNRYIHICHPHQYVRIFTVPRTLLLAVCLWLISFLMEMPGFIGWGGHTYDNKTMSCVWDRTADLSYTIFFSTVGVGLPVTIISICYLKIYQHVEKSKKKIRSATKSKDTVLILGEARATTRMSKERHDSMKLAKTLFIIFCVFIVCWAPYAVIVVADVYDTFPMQVHFYSVLIAHTNSSFNCILYGLTNEQFRKGYRQIWDVLSRVMHFSTTGRPSMPTASRIGKSMAISMPVTEDQRGASSIVQVEHTPGSLNPEAMMRGHMNKGLDGATSTSKLCAREACI